MKNEKVSILLVDDNPDDCILVEDAFQEAKLLNLVQTLSDGEEAMAYLLNKEPYQDAPRPGIIFLDINMPKMNGFEVLKQIKETPHLSSIPIVILTTSEQDEDIARSYAGGACSFISKPVDFQKFSQVVSQFELYWTLVARVPNTI